MSMSYFQKTFIHLFAPKLPKTAEKMKFSLFVESGCELSLESSRNEDCSNVTFVFEWSADGNLSKQMFAKSAPKKISMIVLSMGCELSLELS